MKWPTEFPDQNPYPVLRVNRGGVILYANPASEALLRLWKAEVGQTLPEGLRAKAMHVLETGLSQDVEVTLGEQVLSRGGYKELDAPTLSDLYRTPYADGRWVALDRLGVLRGPG